MGSVIPADVAAPDVRLARRRQVEAAVDELRRALREEAPTYMKHVATWAKALAHGAPKLKPWPARGACGRRPVADPRAPGGTRPLREGDRPRAVALSAAGAGLARSAGGAVAEGYAKHCGALTPDPNPGQRIGGDVT